MKKNKNPNASIVNEEFNVDSRDNCCCGMEDEDTCCHGDAAADHECCNGNESCNNNECKCEASDTDSSELISKLNIAEAKRDEYLSMAQRLQADFDNFRRRNKNAVADAYKAAAADVIETLLPVLDNLDRAVESAIQNGAPESFVKGVEMVQRQFIDTLKKHDVEEIEALGLPFDPELHEAIMQVEAKEGQEENTVAFVVQKGYRTKDKVLRYSMVHVVQ